MLNRFLAIGAGLDLESGALKGASQETPEGIVVFGEKDASHIGLFSAKSSELDAHCNAPTVNRG